MVNERAFVLTLVHMSYEINVKNSIARLHHYTSKINTSIQASGYKTTKHSHICSYHNDKGELKICNGFLKRAIRELEVLK